MTRFQRQLSGELGPYWVEEAKKDAVEAVRLANESATVDVDGAISWKTNGSYLMDDFCEKLAYMGFPFSREETARKRKEQVESHLEALRNKEPYIDEEMLAEMRNAFGEGTMVVNVLTGRKIRL